MTSGTLVSATGEGARGDVGERGLRVASVEQRAEDAFGGDAAGGGFVVEGFRGGVDGLLDKRNERGQDAFKVDVRDGDGGRDDAVLQDAKGVLERGLEGVVVDAGGDALGGERFGERGGNNVDGGRGFGEEVDEERKLREDGGVDFCGRKPDEVFVADADHSGGGAWA